MNARQWTDLLLPDALNTHLDWLKDLVSGDDALLANIARSRTARRLLARETYSRYGIVPPPRASLTPAQQWLLAAREQQLALARLLGIAARHTSIRLTIDAAAVATLRKELGDDGYRKATTQPGLATSGLDAAQFRAAIERNRLADHFVGLGAALLETTLPDEPFYRLRMGFIFSPACWQARPRAVRVDAAALAARIAEATR